MTTRKIRKPHESKGVPTRAFSVVRTALNDGVGTGTWIQTHRDCGHLHVFHFGEIIGDDERELVIARFPVTDLERAQEWAHRTYGSTDWTRLQGVKNKRDRPWFEVEVNQWLQDAMARGDRFDPLTDRPTPETLATRRMAAALNAPYKRAKAATR